MCESYDHKCKTLHSASFKNSTCSSLQQCDETWPGSIPACYALLAQSKEGGLSVLRKGCTSQIGKECTRSHACNGQRKRLRNKLQPLYYCCCIEDNCNRDVIMFLKEEKEEIYTMDGRKSLIRLFFFLIKRLKDFKELLQPQIMY